MRLLLVGDLHGDLADASRAIYHAQDLRVDEIVQLGDWGFLWPGRDDVANLEHMLFESDVHMRFLDGNHDDHPRLRAYPEGERNVSPHLTYQRRGSVHAYPDGTRAAFLGGAVSIDRKHRVEGRSWWLEERTTDEEADRLGPAHVLFTHDAPRLPHMISPLNVRALDDASEENRRVIERAMARTGASMLVHGHFHVRYSSQLTVLGRPVQVEGLSHGYSALDEFCMLLDTKEMLG